MKIIIDAFGGDKAPLEIMQGAAVAVAEYGVNVIMCGDKQALLKLAGEKGIPLVGMEFAEAGSVIPVEEDPTEIIKSYADSSMAVGLKLLSDGNGDAFVTAGSTGAAVVGSSLIVKRIKGIKRAAIATIIPTSTGCYILIDSGANAECRPEMLVQFGIMGSAYMKKLMRIDNPRVGLINIGAEDTKGLELHIEANRQLKEAKVNFIGNVEARELPLGGCDVAVADGFTGNIVLKLTEGMGKLMSMEVKNILMKGFSSKLAALALKKGFDGFKKKFDYTEYGGAPLLGISKPVIKAHGSSDAKAIKNAIRQAKDMCENNVIGQIIQTLGLE